MESKAVSSFRGFNTIIQLSQKSTNLFITPSIRSLRMSASKFPRGNFSCKCAVLNNSSAASMPEPRPEKEHDHHLESESSSYLTALSPLDGQYRDLVKDLYSYSGEYGLNYYRILVEVKWLLKLSQIPEIPEVPSFSEEAQAYLQGLIDGFCKAEAEKIIEIEKVTNHDVKAVEYYLKNKCQSHPEISKVLEFFHFACTSEDINNLAHGLRLKHSLNKVVLPVIDDLIKSICKMAEDYASTPMPSHTHGQPATPTTVGKEMAVFAHRLSKRRQQISRVELEGKFAGAVGNYNAHYAAYPDINWPVVCKEFVESLGLCFNPCVTQIEPHDSMSDLFSEIAKFNTVLIGYDRDMWSYISKSYFKQISKSGEVGSSTMPHKVNPINFENSEGNLKLANGTLSLMSSELLISRLQRDLTDSTVLRNMETGLGYSLVSYKSILKGITKLEVNRSCLDEDLNKHWELLAEAIQTVMRAEGVPEPYEKLKELTRGKAVTRESIRDFILGLELSQDKKKYLLELTPHTYIGLASELAQSVKGLYDQ